MKHAQVSYNWRAHERAHHGGGRRFAGVMSALAFNLCLILLPLAAATALLVVSRDHLYAYAFSESGARRIAARVADLNGELIQLDFDRQNQWDSLVALELRGNDFHAARGFLLSGAGMLRSRAGSVLTQEDASDNEVEAAALQLLTPSTRERYERAAAQQTTAAPDTSPLGTPDDFLLLARAMINEPDSDPLQFMLTGYSLGLAGDLSPRMHAGVLALLDASRREDYPDDLAAQVLRLLRDSAPINTFATAAQAQDGPITYERAAAAFRLALVATKVQQVRTMLDQIGAVSEVTSRGTAALLLTHATSLRDLPRLQLLAQAAGDRVAAAAKRLPRDGRLIDAARGQLTMNQDLIAALVTAGAALAGLIFIVLMKLFQGARALWRRWRDDDDYAGSELVEISSSNWRPL